MSTLVTGATGLVGNNLVRLLLERGESVRVLARESSDPRPLSDLDVEVIRGDVCNTDDVRRAVAGCGTVLHSAALVHIGWSRLGEARAVNVDGTRHVAAAARAAGVRMVHVSTVDALGTGSPQQPADEDSPRTGKVPCSYVVTKREAEQVVAAEAERGLDAVVVNPGFMLGPWDWKPSSGRMLVEVAQRFTPVAPWGGCSVCDVRDVAEGILAAAGRGATGRQYILAGENLTYFDLWKLMAEVSGGEGPRVRIDPLVSSLAGIAGDVKHWLTRREGDVNSAAVGMSNRFHYYSSGRAAAELGYRHHSAREAAEAAWRWFVEHEYV